MVTVCGITALSALLTAYCLTCEGFWIDEAQSWHYSQRSGAGFLRALRVDPSMPLYYVLLHFWLQLNSGEAFIRLLSAIFTVATVPLVYLIGRDLLSIKAGIVAALLLAINNFAVAFGQEARGYALTQFLVVLMTYLLATAISRGSRRAWMLYGCSAFLAVASHAFALYVLGAHLLTFLGRPSGVPWKRVVTFTVLFGSLGLALLFGPLGDVVRRHRFFWISPPTVESVLGGIGTLTGQATGWYTVPYLALAAAGAAILGYRLGTTGARTRWRPLLALSWATVPLVGSVVASFWVPMFIPRYLIVILPALVLLTAVGITSIPRLGLSLACLVVLMGIGTQALNVYYGTRQKEGWREATAVMLDNAQTGDHAIFIAPAGAAAYSYYRDRLGPQSTAPEIAYPAYDPAIQDFKRAAVPELVHRIPNLSGRVWLVLAYEWLGPRSRNAMNLVVETLGEQHVLVERRHVFGVKLHLYEREPI